MSNETKCPLCWSRHIKCAIGTGCKSTLSRGPTKQPRNLTKPFVLSLVAFVLVILPLWCTIAREGLVWGVLQYLGTVAALWFFGTLFFRGWGSNGPGDGWPGGGMGSSNPNG